MTPEEPHLKPINEKPGIFPVAGLIFGLFIWVCDALIDVLLLENEQNLLENIFSPDEPTELWMRLLILLVFVLMGFYSRYVLIKHIELDKILLENQQKLENIITERTQGLLDKTRELEILASTDALTGLYNRRKFTEILDQELDRFQRYQQSFCIITLDIDHFKNVNDTYGHETGDKVLKQFADTLKSNIRRSDKAGRWGGEEFMLLILESDAQQTVHVLEKIKKTFSETTFDQIGKVTASYGVTQVSKDDTHDDIVRRSDQAMYKAKENGRDRIEVMESS